MLNINENCINYAAVFQTYMNHSNNLLLIISEELLIIEINSYAEKILDLPKNNALNSRINILFKEELIKLYFNSNKPNISECITYLSYEQKKSKIIWQILPIIEPERKLNSYLLIGKLEYDNPQGLDQFQFEHAVKYAPGLFYWKDINSVYQGCNEEFVRLSGLKSSTDVKGKTDFDLIWEDKAQLYQSTDKAVIESGVAKLNHIETIVTSDDKRITVITNKVPLHDSNGKIIGILGITTDISHQKEIEKTLKAAKELAEVANQAKTQFIANMSHDIRTPLGGVIGMSKVIEDSTTDPDQKQYAQWIYESGDQLLTLLNDILAVVSAENINDSDLKSESFDFYEFIDDIVRLELPFIKLKNLILNVEITPSIPQFVISDRTKLQRIILNLVGNAIKFTHQGSITISVELLQQMSNSVFLRFSISDTGIGIAEADQSKIFERFFRISGSFKDQVTGDGVGLNIAQSYAHILGSTINLKSILNQGTTFYFDLHMNLDHISE